MLKIVSVLLLTAGIFMFSCSKDSPTEPEKSFFDIQGDNGFVGKVSETNAFIALVIASDEGIVYVCNGEEEIAEWFRGHLNDPQNVTLANSAGAEITAQFKGDSFEGNVTLRDKRRLSFTAAPNKDKDAGIYRVYGEQAEQDEIVAGWILDSDGDERGSLRIRSIFSKNNARFRDISDGTSKTVMIGQKSFPFRSFRLQRAGADSVSIVAPNN